MQEQNKFVTFMEEKFIPVAAKLGSQRHLLAIRDGVVMMMPLLIIGAFSMVIAEFPYQGFLDFMVATFGENGVWIGGSGATLAMVLYLLFFAKSELLKNISKIGILPGLFNINEPVTFGLPIVLNPILMIPYILAPIAAMTVQYAGTAIGLFPLCNNMVPWTTPVLISGFLTTGSFMGVVAQLCGLVTAFVIWLPFIRAYDMKCYREEREQEG